MIIRRFSIEDSQSVADLSEQLGYPMSSEVASQRIESVSCRTDHCGYVAELDGRVVGWIQVYIADILEALGPYAEIGGLVVDQSYRGHGIGRALVDRASEWARETNVPFIQVRTNSKRLDAQAFYEKLGFEAMKTQVRYEKKL